MGFKARMNFPNRRPQVRAYLHEDGLEKVYGSENPIEEAREYLIGILNESFDDNLRYNFILASIWGKTGKPGKRRIIDFCGLSDIDDSRWPGNPDVKFWVIENGLYLPRGLTCGDSVIAFGEEERFRRTTMNLNHYSLEWPDLEDLEPPESKVFGDIHVTGQKGANRRHR